MSDNGPSLGQLFDIAVFGGNGWLGRKIALKFGCIVAANVDIAESDQVADWLDEHQPNMIINAAGRAGPPTKFRGIAGIPQNIDWCNLSDETRALTKRANVIGPRVLGRLCADRGIKVVHLSSGCLWNGRSPRKDGAWCEKDEPEPVSFYSETKVQGEQALIHASSGNTPLIVRLRLPIDGMPDGRNLITKLVKYPEIMDVFNSVTVVDSFLSALEALVRDGRRGIYHVTNPGPVSHRELMDWYCEIVDTTHRDKYEIMSVQEIFDLGRATEGRSNCILNTQKLQEAGIELSNSRTAVRKCLQEYKDSMAL